MTWLTHVKKTMKEEAGKKKTMGKKWFSHVLKTAKRTYHKKGHRRGGEASDSDEKPEVSAPTVDETAPAAPTAGRRRRGRKTQRRSRK